jgi:long-chain acyl-CoA synthetase
MELVKQTLYYFLKEACETHGDNPVFRKKVNKVWKNYSFSDWYEWIKELSAGLIDLGVKHQNRVGLIADNRLEWMVCSMAITTCGAIDVPRGTDSTVDDLIYITKHTETQYIFIENQRVVEKIKSKLTKFGKVKHIIIIDGKKPTLKGKKCYTLDEVRKRGKALIKKKGENVYLDRGMKTNPEEVASIIYTSGTTGTPKGVMLTHRNFIWQILSTTKLVHLDFNDSTLCFLPPWHIAERILELVLIGVGACGNMTTVPSIKADAATVKPTFLLFVPRIWEGVYKKIHDNVGKKSAIARGLFKFSKTGAILFVRAKESILGKKVYSSSPPLSDYLMKPVYLVIFPVLFLWNGFAQLILGNIRKIFGGKVRFAVCGAGALQPKVDLFFRAAGIPILETYGMTETTAISTFRRLEDIKFKTLGPTVKEVDIQLRTVEGEIINQPGVKGIAWHKGPHIMKGYFKEKAKTDKAIDKYGYLDSGDLLAFSRERELVYLGREKDTIVLSGGENLEPAPIEDKLRESFFINQVMVVGQDEKSLGVIITPAVEFIEDWAKQNGVKLGDQKTWNENPNLRNLYKEEIRNLISTESGFKPFERITGFHILHKDFDPGVEMTQTMKIKRSVVTDMYEKEINEIYS